MPGSRCPLAACVVGLGYGDEGKGAVVDHLARTTPVGLVIRHNGGAQAAHHVMAPNGASHCFSQFGAGLFTPQVHSLLLAPMMVDPLAWQMEYQALLAQGLTDLSQRCRIDPDCAITTPYHRYANQLDAVLKGHRHPGTCGRGIHATFTDQQTGHAITVADLAQPRWVYRQLVACRERYLAQMRAQLEGIAPSSPAWQIFEQALTPEIPDYLTRRYRYLRNLFQLGHMGDLQAIFNQGRSVVFEGAQGSLLDMDHGFWPHVTPSHTTARNPRQIMAQHYPQVQLRTLGVIRAYLTRHGQGPLVTESAHLAAHTPLHDRHNGSNPWQGALRYGWFDAVAVRYALALNGGRCDHLRLTCLDQLAGLPVLKLAVAYQIPPQYLALAQQYFVLRPYPNQAQAIAIQMPVLSSPVSRQGLTELLKKVRPLYQEYDGFELPAPPLTVKTLPAAARAYLAALGEALDHPVSGVTLGPQHTSSYLPLDKSP